MKIFYIRAGLGLGLVLSLGVATAAFSGLTLLPDVAAIMAHWAGSEQVGMTVLGSAALASAVVFGANLAVSFWPKWKSITLGKNSLRCKLSLYRVDQPTPRKAPNTHAASTFT